MPSYLFLLLLFPSFLLATSTNPPLEKNPRIIGGAIASEVFPVEVKDLFVVFLVYQCPSTGRGSICSGSLIDENTVLTGAHCFYYGDECPGGGVTGYISVGFDRIQPVESRELSKQVVHPDYNYNRSTPLNDIALWFLSSPFTVVETFAKLPKKDLYIDSTVFVAGYGYIDNDGTLPGELRVTSMKIVDGDECQELYQLFEIRPFNSSVEICAGSEYQGDIDGLYSGTCGGDSGGPAFWDGTVYGTVQFGTRVCGAVPVEGYTRLTAFREWIIQEVRQINGYDFMSDDEPEVMVGDMISPEDIHSP